MSPKRQDGCLLPARMRKQGFYKTLKASRLRRVPVPGSGPGSRWQWSQEAFR